MAKSIETTFDDTSEAELPEAASSTEASSAKAAAGTAISAVSLLTSGTACTFLSGSGELSLRSFTVMPQSWLLSS